MRSWQCQAKTPETQGQSNQNFRCLAAATRCTLVSSGCKDLAHTVCRLAPLQHGLAPHRLNTLVCTHADMICGPLKRRTSFVPGHLAPGVPGNFQRFSCTHGLYCPSTGARRAPIKVSSRVKALLSRGTCSASLVLRLTLRLVATTMSSRCAPVASRRSSRSPPGAAQVKRLCDIRDTMIRQSAPLDHSKSQTAIGLIARAACRLQRGSLRLLLTSCGAASDQTFSMPCATDILTSVMRN